LTLLLSSAELGNHAEENRLYKEAVLLEPTNPSLVLALAASHLHLSDFSPAILHIREVTRLLKHVRERTPQGLQLLQRSNNFASKDQNDAIEKHAQDMLTATIPQAMLTEAKKIIAESKDAIHTALPLIVGVSQLSRPVFEKEKHHVLGGSVPSRSWELLKACRVTEAIQLLQSVELANREYRFGVSSHFFVTLAITLQIGGQPAASRRAAQEAISLCQGVKGNSEGWQACSDAFALLADYPNAFRLIREAHAAARVGQVYSRHPGVIPGKEAGAESMHSESFTRMRIEHDSEQLSHLFEKGLLPATMDVEVALEAYTQLAGVLHRSREDRMFLHQLSPDLQAQVAPYWNRVDYLPRSFNQWHWNQPALRPREDFALLEASFREGEIVVIDDFLTPEALDALVEIANDAQIWHSTKKGSYLGAFRDDGFGPAPLAKLASELHEALPAVIGANTLCMQWGFKHDSHHGPEGIKVHADEAVVNLNFWVSPDEANTDPESGGLVVFDRKVKGPLEGDGRLAYNNHNHTMTSMGLTEGDIKKRIPYRQSSPLYNAI